MSFVSYTLVAFGSLFSIVDPFAAVPIFLALVGAQPRPAQARTALRASATCFVVLTTFALAGGFIFHFFGITLPAFKITGGILLFGVGFEMMRAKRSATRGTSAEAREAETKEDVGVIPIGLPLLSGPGAIATVIVLVGKSHGVEQRVCLFVAIAAVSMLSFLTLRSAELVARVLGKTGINIVERVMGLILAAVATQLVIDGLHEAFPLTAQEPQATSTQLPYTDPMALERLDDGIFVATSPLSFLGLRIGTRMTIVRLEGGGLWVHSPLELTPDLRAEIDALGPVEHVVAPSLYHHLFAGAWRAAYPGAALYGPAALARKRSDLKLSAPLEEAAQAPWAAALVPVHIDGTLFDETVFVHRATRTLVASDLVENFETSPHLPTRLYLKASGIHGKAGIAAPLKLLYRDRAAARKSIDAVLALDFDRMVLAHGDVLREGGKSAVRSTYEFLGG